MAIKETKLFMRDEDGFTLATISARDQLKSQRLTVTTTATSLPMSGGLSKRRFLFIRNLEDPEEVIYIGGSGVTSDEGFPLKRGQILQLDVTADVTVKGIVAANSAEVAVLEVNEWPRRSPSSSCATRTGTCSSPWQPETESKRRR